MQEQFIHFAALAEMEIAFGMADCDLAVARMLVITGLVREVMAGPGVQPLCRFPASRSISSCARDLRRRSRKRSSQGIVSW
jgi:hypothetical protein